VELLEVTANGKSEAKHRLPSMRVAQKHRLDEFEFEFLVVSRRPRLGNHITVLLRLARSYKTNNFMLRNKHAGACARQLADGGNGSGSTGGRC